MSNTKVTLEQLIKKKLEKDGKVSATKDIYIESLGGCITFSNPTDTMRVEYSEKTKSGSYVDMVAAMSKLIYDCCPTLHSSELQKEIGADYPYDTVKLIFDVEEITELGVKLIKFFDEDEDNEKESAEDTVKN